MKISVFRPLCLFLILNILSGTGSLRSEQTAPDSADTALAGGSDIVLHAVGTESRIRIDGVLDDPAWSRARPYHEHFFQQEPLDRAPSGYPTEIRILQDAGNIYFGIQCYDDPEKIFATTKRRDGNFLRDDALELLIDTFQDKRNSYAFGTNPYGIKVDAIISDEGNHINKSWDCIWHCRTAVNDSGWAVEMAIPFKSLKYKHGERVDWGLNITREIKHLKEITYLAPIPRGLGHNGKFKGSLFATITGIRPPDPALNLEVKPYLSAGRSYFYHPDEQDSRLDGGFDARYHVTTQLALDLTFQTDFAQAEAEQEVINLTRFNVNLPEKREFFLESAGMFNFGSGAEAGGSLVGVSSQNEYKLFESRTIGIHEGQRIPLLGGAKFAGRSGRYSIGVLNIQSEETTVHDTTFVPSTNFTAVKIKRDLFTNSNIGFMFLNKHASGTDYSRALGTDAFFAFSPEFMVNGSLAKSFSDEDREREWAGDIGAIYNSEWLDMSLRYTHVDTLFNPEMGFVRRGNIRTTDGTVSLTKWINSRRFKSLSLINDVDYMTDHHNTLVNREIRHNAELTFASEDEIYYGLHHNYEYLPSEDYIREVAIGQGGYSGIHHHLEFSTYRARPLSGTVHYRWGDRLDGRTKSISLSGNARITGGFNVDFSYSHEKLDLLNGSLDANLLSTRWTYSFSTELFAKLYVQWNDADKRIATNLLIDYIYTPRSHIYLVFNENRDTSLPSTTSNVQDRLLLLKWTYLWSI